ncbi:hypothetical protein [Dyadobacter alkalitolerans]|uniref:hypothetical protein n=1 Tax=Dyadobacter alkalitolerans TaxID=492736 RepID=UPI000479CACB|nr:hypothetical protein [Dyadobacter alkalitolerans]
MRKSIIILLVAICLSNCKDDTEEPNPKLESIVGKWRLIEKEVEINGQKMWQKASDRIPYTFSINPAGVVLDNAGLPACCGPKSFMLNGIVVKIESATELPINPTCATVNCAPCDVWGMDQKGNELIISYCELERAKFIKE